MSRDGYIEGGGRPARFVAVDEAARNKIKEELVAQGWHVGDYEDAQYGRIEQMAMVSRGVARPIRLGFGGGFHQRWAHAIAFPDPTGKTMIRSNCTRKVHDKPTVASPNWQRPGHKFYRGPCGGTRCLKCSIEREMRTIARLVDRVGFERKLEGDGEETNKQGEGLQGAGA
jgi:hypothetical protein